MKNIIILMSIVTFIFIIILIIQNLLEKRRLEIYKKNLLQDKDEKELKLMIGYNYISNLNKLDSIINEIIESNLDKEINTESLLDNVVEEGEKGLGKKLLSQSAELSLGTGIGIAALGVAAGLMIAGYAGGGHQKPTKPKDSLFLFVGKINRSKAL